MPKPTAQQCHALTTYFVSQYTNIVGRSPVVNRNKSRWGFESMLVDYSSQNVKDLIDYYLNHYDSPSIDWFLFNYDKIDLSMQEAAAQAVASAKRRKETEKRLKEWRERWNK